jgi:hypothetical protein
MDDPSSRNGPNKHNFELDKYLSNPAAKVRISSPGAGNITGVLFSDFNFGIGSEYQSLFDIADIEKLSMNVNRITAIVNAASSFTKFKKIPQARLKAPGLTTKQFVGSKDLRFSINILLIQYNEEQSLKKQIDILSKLCLPTIKTFGTRLGVGVYQAPLGYAGEVLRNRSNGKVAITIGGWFKAMSQIVYDVQFEMSRVASDKNGTPLYATVNIQFGPSIEIGLEEFQSYFLDV